MVAMRVGDRLGAPCRRRDRPCAPSASTSVVPVFERDFGDVLDERLEVVVAGDEVRLRIHLDDDADVSSPTSAATRPSAATRSAFLAALERPFLRSQSTAASMSPSVCGERRLAVHHAGAGALAQFLHEGGGDRGHG